MKPLVITAAVVGGELTRQDTPHVPLTPQEIAFECIEVRKAGAHIVHLHARDKSGQPKHRVDLFEDIVQEINQQAQASHLEPPILQFSTGGSVGMTVEERMAPLSLLPEMATLTTGTVNFGDGIFENSADTMKTLAKALKSKGIAVELEIFDAGMIDNALRLKRDDLLPEHLHFNFVLGVPGGLSGDLSNLVFLVSRLPSNATWGVAGIGRSQLPLAVHAIVSGGHVRVGLEDNIFYRKGEFAKGNRPLVERVVRIAAECDRPLATLAQARDLLGIPLHRRKK